MNKIIILLFALLFFAKIDINGQYFPDTAKTFFATTSQTDWIEVTTFPPWASNDSISGVTVGGINYVRRDMRTTTFDAQSVGILANGSDMSSRIIRVLNNSKVQKLIFTSNGNGIIIINSDITIPSGKNIEIDGVILKGTSGIKLDINNNIVIVVQQVRMLKDQGGDATFVRADVSQAEDNETMVSTAEKTYGKLNVVFNNAGK